jgi:ATP-dependent Lhr-like helicase
MRLWVEQAIRDEKLKVVVCTSSLDLGVDFAPVESIVQIGSPKGVARFLQRAGRSGHAPGKSSRIYFVPTYSLELLEAKAIRTAVEREIMEDRKPYELSFDVLAQYLVTLAVSDGFYPDQILEEILQTHAFQYLDLNEWQWILNYISKGSQSMEAYDEFRRVEVLEDGMFKVNSRRVAMRHRMQIGTIVGDGELRVKFVKGGYLGTVEEWFLSKLEPGDSFIFAGRVLQLVRIREMIAQVKISRAKKPKVVSWMGGRMTLSAQLGALLREEMQNMKENRNACKEFKALSSFLEKQEALSAIPSSNQLLIESFESREGHHLLVYPFEGRYVHEAMCALLAYRISQEFPISFSLAYNYGFEILSDQFVDPELIRSKALLRVEDMHEDLLESVNAAEIAKRTFRDIAVISGLVFTGPPDKRKKDKHLQSSAQMFFSVFEDYEPENLLFNQAYSEVYAYQFQQERMEQAMQRMSKQELLIQSCPKPSPFSFPIITDRLRARMSSEALGDKIKRMIAEYTKA